MKSQRTNLLFIEQVGASNVQLDYTYWRGKGAAIFSVIVPISEILSSVATLPPPDAAIFRPAAVNREWLKMPKLIKSWSPRSKTLFVLGKVDQAGANRILRAGAEGILLASEDEAEILLAIQDILSGSLYLSSDIFKNSCLPLLEDLPKTVKFTHRKGEICAEQEPPPGTKAKRSSQVKSFRRIAPSLRLIESVGA